MNVKIVEQHLFMILMKTDAIIKIIGDQIVLNVVWRYQVLF